MRLVFLLILVSASVHAATYTAASTSLADVQAALDLSTNGDTVSVPAGTSVWTNSANINFKSITFHGAGIGSTIITRAPSTTTPAAINAASSFAQTNFVTISGFTLYTSNSAAAGIIHVGVPNCHGFPSNQFRITNCKIIVTPQNGTSGRGIAVDAAYGLIDNCYFQTTNILGGQMVTVQNDAVNSTTNSWHIQLQWGDTNVVCMEDNIFEGPGPNDGAFDAYVGQRVVFRHNLLTNLNIGWHGWDSSVRSPRSFEVYQNQFYTANGVHPSYGINIRGGTAVIWSNTWDSGFSGMCTMTYYASDQIFSRAGGGGVVTGSNPVDGNFVTNGASAGYPLGDQPGRGSFPVGNPGNWPNKTQYATNEYEVLDPIYQWGNTFGVNTSPLITAGSIYQTTNYVKANVDYYDNVARPAYVPLVYPHPLQGVVPPPPNTMNTVRANIGRIIKSP